MENMPINHKSKSLAKLVEEAEAEIKAMKEAEEAKKVAAELKAKKAAKAKEETKE